MPFFASRPPWFFLFLSRTLPLACVGKLDLPAVSRGPSPLPEPAPAGDIVTGELSCFTLYFPSLFLPPRLQPAWMYTDFFNFLFIILFIIYLHGTPVNMHTSPILPKGARCKDVDANL